MVTGNADLAASSFTARTDVKDWSRHWSGNQQQSVSQRFFSFYRSAVFAWGVRYFIERHFPQAGVFVEAGSGTSETSSRIHKHGGARKLLALDFILPVLRASDPNMDGRVCGMSSGCRCGRPNSSST
jgi:hypothetical protein